MISFLTDKLRKNCFGPVRISVSFSTAQTEKNHEKNWENKLVKTSHEFMNWLCTENTSQIRDFL